MLSFHFTEGVKIVKHSTLFGFKCLFIEFDPLESKDEEVKEPEYDIHTFPVYLQLYDTLLKVCYCIHEQFQIHVYSLLMQKTY